MNHVAAFILGLIFAGMIYAVGVRGAVTVNIWRVIG